VFTNCEGAGMFHKFKKYFVTGLVVFLPGALTVYIFFITISFADNILGKYLEPVFMKQFGFYVRGISILLEVYIIVLIGFLFTNFLGRKVYDFFDKLLVKLPFFKQVYPALKEMAIFLFSREQLSTFRQVVLVEYPRKGIYSLGFLTNDSSKNLCDLTKQDVCNVFIPTTPSPLTGFVIIVPKKEVIHTDIKLEDAFKLIVSGGVINPE
jgi:uncharacterized membrane protein